MPQEYALYKIKIQYPGHTHKDIIVIDDSIDIEGQLWDKYSDHDLIHDIDYEPFTIAGYKITVRKE